jgi:isopentenyl phosphate kinase
MDVEFHNLPDDDPIILPLFFENARELCFLTVIVERATVLCVNRPVFLKLGGSLITEKTRPFTPRTDVLQDLSLQIARALHDKPDLHLVLGHGSVSFGHVAADRYQTKYGVAGAESWRGFSEVWYQAAALNRLVIDELRHAGVPALSLAPVSAITTKNGHITAWNLSPLKAALVNGLVPVIYGDVIFDSQRGGTILSTEDLFSYLARTLKPQRILLAGLEAGVWADYPERKQLLSKMTPADLVIQTARLNEATGVDVTGGMRSKVTQMLSLVKDIPALKVLIFSGEQQENICRALLGEAPGTLLHR